jgi:hypothetical protein
VLVALANALLADGGSAVFVEAVLAVSIAAVYLRERHSGRSRSEDDG